MKQRGKKSLKITDAVVRGSKNAYEFEVFPIETEFEPQSAVYIFSQRKTDKTGRGHQKFFCIGQTNSLDGEFSKFKKQFASKYKANVICVRIEEEENLRSEIEKELKNLYSISCLNNIEKIPAKTEKRFPAKPISKERKTVQPEKETSVQKPLKKPLTKPSAEKASKIAAEKDQMESVKKLDKTGSKKTVKDTSLKNTKKVTVETKVPVKSKKPQVQSKIAKLTASTVKAKNSKQKIKPAPIKTKIPKQKAELTAVKTKKTPATKNKSESKNLKSVLVKTKSKKISKPVESQKNSGNRKIQSNGNGKMLSKNKRKSVTQKVDAKGKNQADKPSSRKQLAF